MFGTTAIPQTLPRGREWQVAQQPDMAPLAQLLAEARQTNALLRNLLETFSVANGLRPSPAKPEDLSFDPLALIERVEWLERQVAELKERQ